MAVALLTDFGWRDGYVGALKGVLLSRAPALTLVDVSHEIPAGDVSAAAYVLSQAAPWFPAGTVHLVVVDPGVGSERRALALASKGQFYVGPDNGVFTLVLAADPHCQAHQISAPRFAPAEASPVFHGRDVFAPAAAHVACGGALHELGPALPPGELVRRDWPPAQREGERWSSAVIHVDGFGNLVTSLALPVEFSRSGEKLAAARVWVGAREIRFARTYGDVAPGELVALRGSSGLLEIACNGGSAAARLGVERGAVVHFAPFDAR
jgi:S-adenosylmethionine hydrolase